MERTPLASGRKEDQTQPLTERALRQGFRGVDTANQGRHYPVS
jgi:hypothetical protein